MAQRLLDTGMPFHAHEVFEDAWKSAPRAERELWRGLAQLAVGVTHDHRGNARGAEALLRRGADTVRAYAAKAPHDLDIATVTEWADAAARAAADGRTLPPMPRLQRERARMNSMTREELTARVLQRHLDVPDPRLKEIITALIAHLHAFASEVNLSPAEWAAGIRFLTDVGHITTDTRQEFVLLSDTLGLSMLVDLIGHATGRGETESTVLGPFWVAGAPWREAGEMIGRPEDGQPLHITGTVRDVDGRPISGAVLDTWQAAGNGLYDVQDPSQPKGNLRGRFRTDSDGRYDIWTTRPVPYPIPDDGPVGRMLVALGRHPWRAPHVHFMVSAPGFETVTTHIFDAAGSYLDSDTVFGVKPSLVRALTETEAVVPGRGQAPISCCRLEFDFALAPERTTPASAHPD